MQRRVSQANARQPRPLGQSLGNRRRHAARLAAQHREQPTAIAGTQRPTGAGIRAGTPEQLVQGAIEKRLHRLALQLDSDRAAAEAAAAGPLASAKAAQAVVTEEQVTAQRRAELRRAQLESEVTAVAEANAQKTKLESEAAAAAAVRTAEAETQRRRLAAEAVEAEGVADAKAIQARGLAEAAATKAQADALKDQSEALLHLKVLETLPAIAHELAAPLAAVSNMTVISTDGANAITKQAVGGFSELDAVLGSTVGFKLSDVVKSSAIGRAVGAAHEDATKAAEQPVNEFPSPTAHAAGVAAAALGAVADTI